MPTLNSIHTFIADIVICERIVFGVFQEFWHFWKWMSEEEFWDFGCMQNFFLKDFIWLSYEPLLYKVKAEDSAEGVGGLSSL